MVDVQEALKHISLINNITGLTSKLRYVIERQIPSFMLERLQVFGSAHDYLSSASELLKNSYAYEWVGRELLRMHGESDKKEFENLLINFFKINEESLLGQLKVTVIKGDLERTTDLLNKITQFSAESDEDHRLLVELAFSRWNKDVRSRILEALVKNGLNVKLINQFGDNLIYDFLHHYAQKGDMDLVDVVKLFLKAGVPLQQPGSTGFPVLCKAVQIRSKELIGFFIDEMKLDPNACTAFEMSPLQWAVMPWTYGPDLEIAKFLVSKGADVNAENRNGKTALDSVMEYYSNDVDYKAIIDFLREHGAREPKKTPKENPGLNIK